MKAARFAAPALAVAAALLVAAALVLEAMGVPPLARSVLLAAALILCVAMTIRHAIAVLGPSRRLEERLRSLASDGLEPLEAAMADLSRGNLAAKAGISCGNGAISAPGELAGTARELDRVYALTREIVQDLSSLTAVPFKRIFYVGAESVREGERCGAAMADLLDGKGDIAVLMNAKTVISQALRFKGFKRALSERSHLLRVVDVREEHEEPERCKAEAMAVIAAHPSLRGIYVTEGTTPAAAAAGITEAGASMRVALVCHDLADATMEALHRGRVSATLSQNPYAQGYESVVRMYNRVVSGEEPESERILTRLDLITRENADEHWAADRGTIVSDSVRSGLVSPLPLPPGKRVRVSLILPGEDGFWKAVAAGAYDASALLSRMGADMDVGVPAPIRAHPWSVEAYEAALDEVAESGSDGLCLPVFYSSLVPRLNAMIDSGIAVATFNSEPLGIRGMVASMVRHARILDRIGMKLSADAGESNLSMERIRGNLGSVADGVRKQADQLSLSKGLLGEFEGHLVSIVSGGRGSVEAARAVREEAAAGESTVRASRASIESAARASEAVSRDFRTLKDNSAKISSVVGAIEDIVTQTGILAINTAIEASRAGESGKGFAVLASEIRKLAVKSGDSIREVRELVAALCASAAAANASMEESRAVMQRGETEAREAERSLGALLASADGSERKAGEIASAAVRMEEESRAFRKSMGELGAINAENQAAAEAITEEARLLSERIAELDRMSSELSRLSKAQEGSVSAFVLEE